MESIKSNEKREKKERGYAVIFYIVIGIFLILFSFYKTGLAVIVAGIILYLISILRKRATKKYAEENPDIEITITTDSEDKH